MLLELCQSYTSAINKGSVPCIESAWTYLCVNENQRAVQESIKYFDISLSNLLNAGFIDEEKLKLALKTLKQESLNLFKSKAVGNEILDFEAKLKLEIANLTTSAKG